MMKKIIISFVLVLLLNFLLISISLAQTEELNLRLSRDWGYGGFNNDIQGLFSMRVSGPEILSMVEFYIDDIKIGEDTEVPFSLQFSTDNYQTGRHSLYAIGFTADNQNLQSNTIYVNIVSAAEGTNTVIRIIGPILGVILIAILLSVGIPAVINKGKKENLRLGEPRNYGFRGGGICPKCHRPFTLHMWGLNLGFSKLDRCPYCGKWSLVRAQSKLKLDEAEKAELEWVKTDVTGITDEEKIRRDIDDSRYQS